MRARADFLVQCWSTVSKTNHITCLTAVTGKALGLIS